MTYVTGTTESEDPTERGAVDFGIDRGDAIHQAVDWFSEEPHFAEMNQLALSDTLRYLGTR